jgi:predicted DCC family thiol-disulfide oxidoreductase YuxK
MKSPVLFYDGYCALCNYWVKFLLKHKGSKVIYVATLESETLAELSKMGIQIPNIDSALFWDGKVLHTKSDVAIQMLKFSKGGWYWFGKFISLFPQFLRNFGYDILATVRYKVFGQFKECPVLPAEFRSSFLP